MEAQSCNTDPSKLADDDASIPKTITPWILGELVFTACRDPKQLGWHGMRTYLDRTAVMHTGLARVERIDDIARGKPWLAKMGGRDVFDRVDDCRRLGRD